MCAPEHLRPGARISRWRCRAPRSRAKDKPVTAHPRLLERRPRPRTTVRPPRFRFFVNDPGLITRDYGYWVENQLRERFDLNGVPVSIDFVRRPQSGLFAKRAGGRGLGKPGGSPSKR